MFQELTCENDGYTTSGLSFYEGLTIGTMLSAQQVYFCLYFTTHFKHNSSYSSNLKISARTSNRDSFLQT